MPIGLNTIIQLPIFQCFRISMGVRLRKCRLKKQQHRLKNNDFSMFTENCLAGVIYHDLGLQFRSPLINGEFSTDDFIQFLKNPRYYLQQDLTFISNQDESLPAFYRELDCPVASIGDLHFRFTHYHMSEEEIREIWKKRKVRINWDNLFIVLCEKKGCTLQQMKQFEALPYERKLILTCHNYPELHHAFHIRGFEDIGYLDNVLKDVPGFFPTEKKYYDQFDFVTWLNTGKIQK